MKKIKKYKNYKNYITINKKESANKIIIIIKIFLFLFFALLMIIFQHLFYQKLNFHPFIYECHNKKINTLFFTRKTHFKSENNISAITVLNNYKYYTETPKEFREKILKQLNLTEKKKMDILSLYIPPYSITKKWESSLIKYINNKYQKINRFLNYKEYISKSLLYLNYKAMKSIFPSDYDYMLESYLYPKDKDFITLKFKTILLKMFQKIIIGE